MFHQKDLFMIIVISMFLFDFYNVLFKPNVNEKDIVKNEEIDKNLNQRNDIKNGNDLSKIEIDNKIKLFEEKRRRYWLDQMLEQKGKCNSIHIWLLNNESNKNTGKLLKNQKTLEDDKINKKSVVSGPIIYLFVIVLVYLLIKAATDISNQFRKKSEDAEESRRCSLKEYANLKNERRISKTPLLRRSTLLALGPVKRIVVEEQRTMNTIIEFNNGAGLITEPGSPAKVTNGIATRPAPLIRRCSVPVFAQQHLGHANRSLRRPSFDSFSEDDSSPDVKRRVRMIHRH